MGVFAGFEGDFVDGRCEEEEDVFEEPPLVIRERDGSVSAEYARVKLAFGFPP